MKGLNNFITQLTPFFFYTVGGYLVIEDRLSFGALVAVLAAHKDFSAPLRELLKYYQTLEDVRVRFHETRRFLAADTSDVRVLQGAPDADRLPANPYAARRPLAAAASVLAVIPKRRKIQPCAPQRYSA
jgi:ABC-type multidrug transport system fused ATPase/permease subunit